MRVVLSLLVGFLGVAGVRGQAPPASAKPAQRFGIDADLDIYPQATPKDALPSAIKAIDRGRVDYMVAQVADPEFVDARVKHYVESLKGRDEFKTEQFQKLDPQTRDTVLLKRAFEELVKETTAKLADDPSSFKELRRFATDGKWEESGDTATASLEDVKDRRVSMRKIQGRWFLMNDKKPEAGAK